MEKPNEKRGGTLKSKTQRADFKRLVTKKDEGYRKEKGKQREVITRDNEQMKVMNQFIQFF